jgi:hypothetical protein
VDCGARVGVGKCSFKQEKIGIEGIRLGGIRFEGTRMSRRPMLWDSNHYSRFSTEEGSAQLDPGNSDIFLPPLLQQARAERILARRAQVRARLCYRGSLAGWQEPSICWPFARSESSVPALD